MGYPEPFTARTDRERSVVERARQAAEVAAPHAARHDRDGSFPEEGLATLAASGYLALAVPESLGGGGATVTDLVLGSLELARGDSALALVVAMHGTLLGRVRDASLWPEAVFSRVARAVADARSGQGALINSLASEPELGSPSRGGMPRTTAQRTADGWLLNGLKNFSSGAPVLRWALVAARVEGNGDERAANFLVPLDVLGVSIEPSWDTLGMRATASHTMVFEDVALPADAELPRPSGGSVPHERAWGLAIAAVYLGIAEAARDAAFAFARERRPTALAGEPIATAPQIRHRAGQIDLQLYQARGLLVSTARDWDAADEPTRIAMDGALAAAKVTVANSAVAVAEQAMRLVGGPSLDRSLPLERYFRDVRGGLYHPPQDDLALELLARAALD